MSLAEQAYNQRQADRAEAIVRNIVAAVPGHPGALHLLGVICYERGEPETGIQFLKAAIASEPGNGHFLSNLAEMCRRQGRLQEAIGFGIEAVKALPDYPHAHANLGIAYYDYKDLNRAEACQLKALALAPKLASARNNLGSIHRERKNLVAAIACYHAVLSDHPGYAEAASNLGNALTENGQPEEAVKVLEPLVEANPGHAEAVSNLGVAYFALDEIEKAAASFRDALKLRQDYPEAMIGMGRVLREQGLIPEAQKMAERILQLRPESTAAWVLTGDLFGEAGLLDKAQAAYAHALNLDPEAEGALLGRGHLLMEHGKMADAEASFREAMAVSVDKLAARAALVQVKTVKSEEEEDAQALIEQGTRISELSEQKALGLHYALGKIYDDLQQYDLAFRHYAEGARLKRKRISYSAYNTDLIGANIRKTFTKSAIAQWRGPGFSSRLPILVLGMPRSGTTLTETILASHPDVYGGGELPDLLYIAAAPRYRDGLGYPLCLQGITQTELAIMGEKYVAGLSSRAPSSPRITDKMPANFNYIGLVHLMLPQAKIVHVRRNAVDTCLSNFTKLFHRSQYHSYDLVELGRYYRYYAEVMEHWRAVLPRNAFYEIQYEELVSHPEQEVRKLLAYCELDWNEACLSFHETERTIKTASITQVRKPMYQSSVRRWRRYETNLGPLLEALGDLAN
jgi:tetratricopeptide (TPR) repeat protein